MSLDRRQKWYLLIPAARATAARLAPASRCSSTYRSAFRMARPCSSVLRPASGRA
jgi:hypothetical protein